MPLDPNIPILAGQAVPNLGQAVQQGLGAYYQAQQAEQQSQLLKAQMAQQEAQAQQAEQFRQAMQSISTGDRAALASMAIQFPEQFEQINKNLGLIEQNQKDDAANFAFKLRNTPFDERARLIKERVLLLTEQGRDPTHTSQLIGLSRDEQDEALSIVEMAALSPEKRAGIAKGATVGRLEKGVMNGEDVFFQMVGDKPKVVKGIKPQENIQKLKMEKEAAEEASAQEKATLERRKQAFLVSQDIGRALDMSKGFTTTGFTGALTKQIPGTNAYTLSEILKGIKANIGFDKLQAMREASPTGGALGQVSEKEIDFLQSVYGSLEQGQTKEQLQSNLNRLRVVFDSIVNGTYPIPFEQAQYDALSSGDTFIDPDDGKLYRKP